MICFTETAVSKTCLQTFIMFLCKLIDLFPLNTEMSEILQKWSSFIFIILGLAHLNFIGQQAYIDVSYFIF